MSHATGEERYWGSILDGIPLGQPYACPYFAEQSARMREFVSDEDLPPMAFEAALNKGFRRCGRYYYQPNCPGCARCVGFRLDVAVFAPTRSQRRVLARNQDLQLQVAEPRRTAAKDALYLRYQYAQHHQRPPRETGPRPFDERQELHTMQVQMYDHPESTRELEMWAGERLVGFGTLDVAVASVSAVYFVFDPEEGRRSLGTLNILASLEWTRQEGRRWLNLGFYIAGHSKMSYKERFGPSDRLDAATGRWVQHS